MIKTFTPNDLLKCLYKEASVAEQNELQMALLCDDSLREEWQNLEEGKKLLDTALPKPSDKATDNIMAYARAMNLAAQKN